jgi:hypothetical protein
MKRFLLGTLVGLFLGWVTVPVVKATYDVIQSDGTATKHFVDDFDPRESHAYKWYLGQMLKYMMSMDQTLKSLNANMQAVKDKLHA